MPVVHVSQKNFEKEVVGSPVPVLAEFWAEWCGPCRALAPVLEELAKMYEGKVKVAKINVSEEAELASRFGVMSIPTIYLFRKGKPIAQTVGARSLTALKSWLESALAQ